MIITRTPLRISIGGGGTDLPSYYNEFGGFVISAAINKYVYISINRSFLPGYFLKYSDAEHALNYEEIRHPLLREALKMHEAPSPLEIVSIADVPAGTGLGSSGAFLVGLTHALHAYARKRVTAETLAQEAVEIEMNRLHEPVGKQDQYIAAYGGLLCQEYEKDGSVRVSALRIDETALTELRDSLMLFFVGQTRNASTLLMDQQKRSEQQDKAMLDGLHFVKQLGREIQSVLESGAVHEFGRLMHEHWIRKRRRTVGMSNDEIDHLYELARVRGGSTGGKLVGAGGSGFLLLQTQDRKRLRTAMTDSGVCEMEFDFDFDGSSVMMRSA
ncbi:galactokinase [Acidobacterium sp. S8]|uniref:GHMP family kinase ATP-binding protein n=1 Tax=Acidobacterium sp. S8 TaxID=1641854 RepID=UPI00131E3FFA|nr:galactokinase [Acidobacterium sp. S8]